MARSARVLRLLFGGSNFVSTVRSGAGSPNAGIGNDEWATLSRANRFAKRSRPVVMYVMICMVSQGSFHSHQAKQRRESGLVDHLEK